MHTRIHRRSLLASLGAAALALPFSSPSRAGKAEAPRRFVSLYFDGGWDVLLGPDPRDPAVSWDGIDLDTARLAPQFQDPIPVTMAGTEQLLGPTMAALARHADVLTLFRGVNMNTVAHITGRAYVNTFIAPAGTVPKGDSLGTRMASAQSYDDFVLPNVAIGLPSFNQSFDPQLNGVGLARATEVNGLLEPLGTTTLSPELAMRLREAQDEAEGCVHPSYGRRPFDDLSIARTRMRDLLDSGLRAAFDLGADTSLLARYAIVNPAVAADPGVIAATIWRLLDRGLSATVTATLQRGFDTHGPELSTVQPIRQRAGFNAMAALLDDLRIDDPQLENTTVLAYSEFARTPRINGRLGRDHWFAGSVLVFGGGLRRGVCGATVPETLGLAAIDVETGLPDPSGTVLLPEHIGATLAAAAGLDPGPFRIDPLTAWIA